MAEPILLQRLGHLQEDILFAKDKFLIVNLGDCDIVNHL